MMMPLWVLASITAQDEQDRMELGERVSIDMAYEAALGAQNILEEWYFYYPEDAD